MLKKSRSYFRATVIATALLSTLAPGAKLLPAQSKQIFSWRQNLNYLKSLSDDEVSANREMVIHIRRGVELWLKPEKSRSWNIGWTHTFPIKTVTQIEHFHYHLRDAIRSVDVVDPGLPGHPFCDNTGALKGYCSQNVNIATENHQGFEISMRSTPRLGRPWISAMVI